MYKALTSFVGKVSMVEGETKEILDKEVVQDLLRAGYIEKVADNKLKKEIKKVVSKNKK